MCFVLESSILVRESVAVTCDLAFLVPRQVFLACEKSAVPCDLALCQPIILFLVYLFRLCACFTLKVNVIG